MKLWLDASFSYARIKGFPPRADLRERTLNTTISQTAEYFKTAYNMPESESEIIEEIIKVVNAEYLEKTYLTPGARELLERLHKQGVKMCVATATETPLVEHIAKRLDIMKYFERVISCTNAGAPKTEPDIYIMALSILGTPKTQTVVVEDALYAVKTATRAGFRVIGVYDEMSAEDEAEMRALADVYLTSLTEWE